MELFLNSAIWFYIAVLIRQSFYLLYYVLNRGQNESYKKALLNYFFFFFYQGFLSRTLTTHRTAGEGRGPSFIPLYHFHRSRTLRHLFATLHVRWLSHIFNRNACIYQTATRWDFTTLSNYHLIDWCCEVNFSLFTWWFDTKFLLQQSWYGKPVDSKSHWLSPLYTLVPLYALRNCFGNFATEFFFPSNLNFNLLSRIQGVNFLFSLDICYLSCFYFISYFSGTFVMVFFILFCLLIYFALNFCFTFH